jgi:hypothetical protein
VKFNSKIVVNCKLLFYLFWDILIYDIFYWSVTILTSGACGAIM